MNEKKDYIIFEYYIHETGERKQEAIPVAELKKRDMANHSHGRTILANLEFGSVWAAELTTLEAAAIAYGEKKAELPHYSPIRR